MDQAKTGTESGTAQAATGAGAQDVSPAIKGYQRLVAEKDRTIAQQAQELAKFKGEPSLEEKLAASEKRAEEANLKLQLAEVKLAAPEVADLVEQIAASTGVIPTADVVEAMRARVASGSRTETSGVRNANAASATDSEDQARERLLREGSLF